MMERFAIFWFVVLHPHRVRIKISEGVIRRKRFFIGFLLNYFVGVGVNSKGKFLIFFMFFPHFLTKSVATFDDRYRKIIYTV